MPTLVYEYGLLPPVSGADIVDQQIRLAHKYRNRLTEIELQRRQAIRTALSSYPEVADLEQKASELETRLEEMRTAIRQARKAARRRVDTSALDAEAKQIRTELKKVRDALREAKRAVAQDESVQAAIREANETAAQAVKQARAESGLYWGTYLMVEKAMDRARKAMADPRFQPFKGSGRIGVQLQGGLPCEAVFGSDSRLQVDPVPEEAWTSPVRGVRRRLSRTKLRIRVGSEGRSPLWAEFPMIMHRPLPAGSLIKWAWVIRDRIATHYRWRVQFVVDVPDAPKQVDGLAVGLDVGWRRVDAGLRVAYWHGEDGDHGELVLPNDFLAQLRKVDDLRSIRDKHFDEIRSILTGWLAVNPHPDWLREHTRGLIHWRSTNRMAALVLEWRDRRFDGDEEIFAALEAWRKRDRHLYDWEGFQRKKVLRRRREIYRTFAAQLSTRYKHFILEDFDLRAVAQRGAPESPNNHGGFRVYRAAAAISSLRQILMHAFAQRGGQAHAVDACNTTMTCHSCGSMEAIDGAAQVWHTCSQCGTLWDQDHNAAINLLRKAGSLREVQC